nr:MAG TPA: hypothetical protein [Caudoviricetes sp.]
MQTSRGLCKKRSFYFSSVVKALTPARCARCNPPRVQTAPGTSEQAKRN